MVPVSVADTCAVFPVPLSAIDDGDTASVTVGAASSSVIVSDAPVTVGVPRLPANLADPVTVSVPGSSRVSSTAVMVTVPELAPPVDPAAMVIVFAVDGAVYAPATFAMVTVVATSIVPPVSAADTVVELPAPLSAMVVSVTDSVTVGLVSSSSSVSCGPVTVHTGGVAVVHGVFDSPWLFTAVAATRLLPVRLVPHVVHRRDGHPVRAGRVARNRS